LIAIAPIIVFKSSSGESTCSESRLHVGKTHFWALGDLAFGVGGLYALGNLLGCLASQSQLCPKFVVRQHGSRG
jgi:hypothetical protein